MRKPLATRWWIFVWLSVPPLTYMASAAAVHAYFDSRSWLTDLIPVGLVAVVLITLFIIAWRQDLYARRCASKVECPECGYSREGLEPGAACPECSHVIGKDNPAASIENENSTRAPRGTHDYEAPSGTSPQREGSSQTL